MFMDKKGQSTGFSLILGIIFLFLIGLGYVVFNQVMTNEISPVSNNLINNSPYVNDTMYDELTDKNDKYLAFWHTMPFIVVVLIAIFLITTSFRKGDDRYV